MKKFKITYRDAMQFGRVVTRVEAGESKDEVLEKFMAVRGLYANDVVITEK